MLLKTVVSLTLMASATGMAADVFSKRSFFPPDEKKVVPVPAIPQLFEKAGETKGVCAIPLLEAKARATGDKLAIPTGRMNFDAIQRPARVRVCKNWNSR